MGLGWKDYEGQDGVRVWVDEGDGKYPPGYKRGGKNDNVQMPKDKGNWRGWGPNGGKLYAFDIDKFKSYVKFEEWWNKRLAAKRKPAQDASNKAALAKLDKQWKWMFARGGNFEKKKNLPGKLAILGARGPMEQETFLAFADEWAKEGIYTLVLRPISERHAQYRADRQAGKSAIEASWRTSSDKSVFRAFQLYVAARGKPVDVLILGAHNRSAFDPKRDVTDPKRMKKTMRWFKRKGAPLKNLMGENPITVILGCLGASEHSYPGIMKMMGRRGAIFGGDELRGFRMEPTPGSLRAYNAYRAKWDGAKVPIGTVIPEPPKLIKTPVWKPVKGPGRWKVFDVRTGESKPSLGPSERGLIIPGVR